MLFVNLGYAKKLTYMVRLPMAVLWLHQNTVLFKWSRLRSFVMALNSIINLVGWVGSAAVISAYALISTGKLGGKSIPYQLLNLVGGIFLVINTFYFGAYPSTFVNLVWAVIAVSVLVKAGSGVLGNAKRETTEQCKSIN